MSQIASIIKQKLSKIEERKNEKPGDANHALAALSDYSLYFQGAGEIADALGADGKEIAIIQSAARLVDAEADALEQRLALLAELG